MESGERVGRLPGLLRAVGRKARGILGLGLFGGIIAGVGGAALNLITSLTRIGLFADAGFWEFILRSTANAGIGFFVMGSIVSATFGTALAITARDRSLSELPLWQMGLLGMGVAAVIPSGMVVVLAGWSALLNAGAPLVQFSTMFAAFGGMLTAGLVAVAKRADRLEITENKKDRARLEPGPVDS